MADRAHWSTVTSVLATWRHLYLFLPLLLAGVVAGSLLGPRFEAGVVKILPVFLGGLLVGMMLFFDHIWGYFFRLGFPLVTAPVYLTQAIAIYLLHRLLQPRNTAPLHIIILCAWLAQQTFNWHLMPPEPYPELVKITPYGFVLPSAK